MEDLTAALNSDSFIISGKGSLSRMDEKSSYLAVSSDCTVILRGDDDEFKYNFSLYVGQTMAFNDVLGSHLLAQFNIQLRALDWVATASRRIVGFRFTFSSPDEELAFKTAFAVNLLKAKSQEKKNLGKDDQNWVTRAHEAEEVDGSRAPADAAFSEFQKPRLPSTFSRGPRTPSIAPRSQATPKQPPQTPISSIAQGPPRTPVAVVGGLSSSSESEQSEDEDEPSPKKSPVRPRAIRTGGPSSSAKKRMQNSGLEIGMASNRTFVVREDQDGSKIGVFNEELELVAEIKNLSLNGKSITANKTQLHERDGQMLLLDNNSETSMFCMDMERGLVIEEWKPKLHDIEEKVRSMAPVTKEAQISNEKTLFAMNRNSIYRIDPRTQNKIATIQQETKAKKGFDLPLEYERTVVGKGDSSGLSCMATNINGQVVVGDGKGAIRFFDAIDGKRAKNVMTGLGDGITGVDVSKDGRYALATTNTYILLIPTASDKKNRTAFDVGLKDKPVPIKLTLEHRDVVRFNIDVSNTNFTRARFNTVGEESWIISSTGNLIITWNFKKILSGNKFAYKIKKTETKVIADDFMCGQPDKVVVIERDDVMLAKRSEMN